MLRRVCVLLAAQAAGAFQLPVLAARHAVARTASTSMKVSYSEVLEIMSEDAQMAELDRLVNSAAFRETAMPNELELLENELRRRKEAAQMRANEARKSQLLEDPDIVTERLNKIKANLQHTKASLEQLAAVRAAASAIADAAEAELAAAVASARVPPQVPAFNHLNPHFNSQATSQTTPAEAMPAQATPLPEVAAAEQASARAADAARVAAEYMHLDFNHQSGYQKYLQQRRKAQEGPASVDPATYRAGINAHRRQQFSAAAIPAVEQTSFQPYVPTEAAPPQSIAAAQPAAQTQPATAPTPPTPPVVQPANPTPAVVSSEPTAPVEPTAIAAPSQWRRTPVQPSESPAEPPAAVVEPAAAVETPSQWRRTPVQPSESPAEPPAAVVNEPQTSPTAAEEPPAATVAAPTPAAVPAASVESTAGAATPAQAKSEEKEEVVVTVEHAFGRDPRLAPPWITENEVLLKELRETSTAEPKKAAASKSPAISSIQTLDDFRAAIEHSEATGKLLVVKYYAPWCRACLNIKPYFEKLAKGAVGQLSADFVEVDAGASRVLCALANIKKMPVVHIYSEGELVGTHEISSKKLFEDFMQSFELHAKGFGV